MERGNKKNKKKKEKKEREQSLNWCVIFLLLGSFDGGKEQWGFKFFFVRCIGLGALLSAIEGKSG